MIEARAASGLVPAVVLVAPSLASPRTHLRATILRSATKLHHEEMQGFRVLSSGKREKSRSALSSSRIPWCTQRAAIRQS